MTRKGRPAIGVVVIHYGADEFTLRCLRSLVADDLSPTTEVVLVDNGPGPGFGEVVRRELPSVRVIEPGSNVGFAAGCNLGIGALDRADLVALVNSDMEVSPGWLNPLVEAIERDGGLGAVCPKIRFDADFHTLTIEAAEAWRPGWGDGRSLAWHLEGVRADGSDITAECQLVEGFWEPDPTGVWAAARVVVRVPATAGVDSVELAVGTPPDRDVRLATDSGTTGTVARGGGAWSVRLVHPAAPVINNVGTAWRADGYGIDLGFQEIDAGQFDEPGPVEAWCGGAVLLRRNYLETTAGFDERLFLYYEDLELGVRGTALGWRYWYEPRSVVAHRHAASSLAHPGRVASLKERNRLLLLARHGEPKRLLRELCRFVAVTASYLRRDVLAPVLRGRRPTWGTVRTRAIALVGALALLPRMLISRRRDRRLRRGMLPLV